MKELLRECPICGSKTGEILHTQRFVLTDYHVLPDEYDVVACEQCGFVYADTGAKQEVYNRFYEIMSKYEDKNTSTGGGFSHGDYQRIIKAVDEITEQVPHKKAKIIDIGCANGGILRELKNRGYTELTGVDPSAICIHEVKKTGIRAFKANLFDLDKIIIDEKFDYIILSHVAEHIRNLDQMIKIIYSLVSNKGKIHIEVPDASRYFEYYSIPFYFFDAEHINHFDEIALSNLLKKISFSIVYIKQKIINHTINSSYPVLLVVSKPAESKSVDQKSKLKNTIIQYIEKSKLSNLDIHFNQLIESKEEIIVWGAGMYTNRLLANTRLNECNIIGFIDKDSTKQRKKLIGKEIYTPSILQSFKGVIVIASVLYSKEIEEEIALMNVKNKVIVVK